MRKASLVKELSRWGLPSLVLALALGVGSEGIGAQSSTPVPQGGAASQGEAPPPTEVPAANPSAAGSWSGRLQSLLRHNLLHNPREQTGDAVDAYREQRFEDSLPPARRARELAPQEPLTGYNRGTLELAAGRTEDAIVTFEETLQALRVPEPGRESGESGPQELFETPPAPGTVPDGPPRRSPESRFRRPELAASTLYNLGNARLSQGDPAAAVEAYEETLRLAPDHEDAKFNLELALRELEKQKPPPQPQQQPQDGEGEGDPPPEPKPGSEEGEDEEQTGEQGQDPDQNPSEPQPQDTRLQEFEDQPDMTAEEAAAILEAVESLERQQRREEAAERARNASARGEKDW